MTVFPPETGTPNAPADPGSRLTGQPSGTGRRAVVVRRARQIVRAYPRPFAMLGLLLVSLALDLYQDGVGQPLAQTNHHGFTLLPHRLVAGGVDLAQRLQRVAEHFQKEAAFAFIDLQQRGGYFLE